MKPSKNVTKFNIVVELECTSPDEVAAEFSTPEGPVTSGLSDVILDSQVLADYEAFIESIQDLIIDYYKLKIYHKNSSNYFGMLAKNDAGEIILDFDFTLRIPIHSLHRNIIVNDTTFDSYEDAYAKVDTVIESVVAVMKRRG